MIEPKAVQVLKTQLFANPNASVFTILDGASLPELLANLEAFDPEQVCLYRGELAPDLAEMAPYLVILPYDSQFTDWVLARCWGGHCGIFGITDADLKTLRKHFRTFLMVYDESGKSLYFRYYDPRVLRLYLPSCNAEELKTVFGPIQSYLLEDKNGNIKRFDLLQETLREENVLLP